MRDESKTEGIDLFVKSLFLPDEQIELDQSEPVDVTGEFLQRTQFGLPGESASLTKSEWDEEIDAGARDVPLAKAAGRRKLLLSEHVRRMVSLGKTISELADYARRNDPGTASTIEEIGAELGIA